MSVALVGSNLLTFFGIWRNLLAFVEPVFSLGKPAVIKVMPNSSSSVGIEVKGSFVDNIYYHQPVYIEMPVTSEKYIIRAKAYISDGKVNYPVKIANNSNWVAGNDDCYYLSSLALGGENISLANGVILPKFNNKQESTYTLIISIESLHEDTDYENIWTLPDNFNLVQVVQD